MFPWAGLAVSALIAGLMIWAEIQIRRAARRERERRGK